MYLSALPELRGTYNYRSNTCKMLERAASYHGQAPANLQCAPA